MTRRVVIIDLDGATFEIIKPMVAENRLPNIQKIMSTGVHGVLKSTIPSITPCAYSSFITGKTPQHTGIFDFVFKRPEQYKLEPVNSTVLQGIPFWKIFNKFNKKVGIINLPMTFPVSNVDGFTIGCGLTASSIHQPGAYYPEDIFDKHGLDKMSYILKPEWKTMRYGSKIKYYDEVIKMFQIRADFSLTLLRNEPWDFFVVHVHAIDWIQHTLWNAKDRVYKIYEKVDNFIGEIMSHIKEDSDANIIIMSDHGFGGTYKTINLSKWLMQLNLLATKDISFERICNKFIEKVFQNRESSVHKLSQSTVRNLPSRIKRQLDAFITFLYDRIPLMSFFYSVDYMDRIDWDRTMAYTYGQIGAIYINAEPGSDNYEKIRSTIIKELYELRDEKGGNLVQKVFTREELFPGSIMHHTPDVLIYPKRIVYFHPDFDTKGVVSPPVRWRMGNHAREGIFIACGNNIKQGQAVESIDITDIIPTVLYSMGLEIPDTMDGKVSEQCFVPEFVENNKPLFVSEENFKTGKDEFVNKESEEITRQLKGLGYI